MAHPQTGKVSSAAECKNGQILKLQQLQALTSPVMENPRPPAAILLIIQVE